MLGARGSSPFQALMNRAAQALGMAGHVRLANSWRDHMNPLRGLTIARAIQYLEAGERGEYADLQWLYRFIEKTDATLIGLLERYDGKLVKLDWTIKTVAEDDLPKGVTKEQAEEQAAYLHSVYDGIDNIRQAICFLIQAKFRGYAHLQKIYGGDRQVPREDGDGFEWEAGSEPREKLTHLEPVPQWFWVRNGPDAPWQYNQGAKSGVYRGEKIEPEAFIIRECERPVNRLALINYVFGNIGRKDWAGFVEVYGIPWIFLVGPPGVPAGKEAEYQAIAEKLIADARGYLPNGADIKTGNAGERGVNPFKEFLSWLREEVVLAGTGGKLTMLAESGSGTLAGGAHQDAWDDIVLGEGAKISEVLQCAIDRPHLQVKFPGRPILAKFVLDFVEEEEATAAFKREVWKGFQMDGTVNDIMANLVALDELTAQVGLPANKGYEEPWLPVRDDKGGMVTGEIIKDKEGDIIGGTAGADKSEPERGVTLEQFRLQTEAYGVAVRAGAITPNLSDEEYFRRAGGLPPVSEEVKAVWREQESRLPITLQQQREEAPGSGSGPLEEGEENNGEDGDAPVRPGREGSVAEPIRNGARAHGGRVANRTSNNQHRTSNFEREAVERLGKALAEDFEPLRKRLETILKIEDPEVMANRLRSFLGEIDQLGKDITADPATAQVLAAIQTAALFNGMEEGARGRITKHQGASARPTSTRE